MLLSWFIKGESIVHHVKSKEQLRTTNFYPMGFELQSLDSTNFGYIWQKLSRRSHSKTWHDLAASKPFGRWPLGLAHPKWNRIGHSRNRVWNWLGLETSVKSKMWFGFLLIVGRQDTLEWHFGWGKWWWTAGSAVFIIGDRNVGTSSSLRLRSKAKPQKYS